jgi:hypothetical protein
MTDAARDFPLGSIRRAVARLGDNWALDFDDLTADSQNPHFRAEIRDAAVIRALTIAKACAVFDPPNIPPGPSGADIDAHAAAVGVQAQFRKAVLALMDTVRRTKGMPEPWRHKAMDDSWSPIKSVILCAIWDVELAELDARTHGRLALARCFNEYVSSMRELFARHFGDDAHHQGRAPR